MKTSRLVAGAMAAATTGVLTAALHAMAVQARNRLERMLLDQAEGLRARSGLPLRPGRRRPRP
ncbi:hypothetical protein ACWC5I_46175, partial [Kitasatospora sp. NPDC001574]